MWLPDNDVLILLMDLVAHGRLGAFTKLNFQIGEGNLLESQRNVGSPLTYLCRMMTPSSLPSSSLAKGCSQAMSWWTVSCLKKCGPSRSLFDQYTALVVQLPHQVCVGNYSGPGIWRARCFLRPGQQRCPMSYAPTSWLWRTNLYSTSPMPTAPRGNGWKLAGTRMSQSVVSTNQQQLPSWN